MSVNLESIKKIELCYENCDKDIIYFNSLLGIELADKTPYDYSYSNNISYGIKTFEIAIKDDFYSLRTDLAQFYIHYLDGTTEHYFVGWGENDCEWDHSSLQKVYKQDNYESLTSNCDSAFLI